MSRELSEEPSTAELLAVWREAERRSVRLSAQREAADKAIEGAHLAADAARATSLASEAALQAATEAARAGNATADAADKVLHATSMEADARRLEETEAVETEAEAKATYHRIVEQHSLEP